jgi:hypothetical protein
MERELHGPLPRTLVAYGKRPLDDLILASNIGKLWRSAHAKRLKSKQKINEFYLENFLLRESVGIWPQCIEDSTHLSTKQRLLA